MKKPINKLVITQDEKGNAIVREGNGFHLQLASESFQRLLGRVTTPGTLLCNRTRSKHLHRKSNSYGFNYQLIQHPQEIKYIHLADERGNYVIPVDVIKAEGQIMQFTKSTDGNQYELQYFLPIDRVEHFHVSGGRIR